MTGPNSNQENTLFSVNFLIVTVAGFIFFFNFHSLLLLPLHIQKLGGSDSTIGFLMGAAGVSTLVSTPVVGYLGDSVGKKLFVVLGLLLLSFSTIALVMIYNTGPLYYSMRLLHGIAFSLFFISAGAIITEIAPADKRAQAVGLYGVFTIVNYALAPYIGKLSIEHLGFDSFFLITGSVTLVSAPVVLLIRTTWNVKRHNKYHSEKYTDILSSKSVFVPAATLLTAGAAFIPTLTFIPVFSGTIGIESFDHYFIVYTLSILFIRIFCGWIPDKYGKSRVTKPFLLLFAISIILLSISNDVGLFLTSAFLFGIAHGFVYPSVYSIVIDNVSNDSRTRAFAICSLSFTAGGMLGTFLAGIIAESFSYFIMYLFISFTALIAFFIFTCCYNENYILSDKRS